MYNVRDYIQGCINSCLEQKISDNVKYEVIIINDGSTDDSLDMVYALENTKGLVRIFSQSNKGVAAARNLGIEKSKGKYIGFVDSDDWISNNYVQSIYNSYMLTKSDIIYFDRNLHLRKAVSEVNYPLFERVIKDNKNIFTELNLSSCNKAYLKEIVGDERFPTGVIYEDFPFTVKMLVKSTTISKAFGVLYQVRSSRVGSITNSLNNNEIDLFNNLTNIEFFLEKSDINRQLVEDYQRFKDRQLIGWIVKHIRARRKVPVDKNCIAIRSKNLNGFTEKIAWLFFKSNAHKILELMILLKDLRKK